MNIKLFNIALGLALTVTALSANAQKVYKEGVVNLTTTMQGMPVNAKSYFRADSVALTMSMGPANVKILSDAQVKSLAVLIDLPIASLKKVGIATPDELDQFTAALPTFTFVQTTETKQISGFNCKKVIATDTKDQKKYDVWVTNDVQLPESGASKYYKDAGGFPIQYTSFSDGRTADVLVKSITEQKVPAGTFSIPADYDRMSLEELNAMRGGK